MANLDVTLACRQNGSCDCSSLRHGRHWVISVQGEDPPRYFPLKASHFREVLR